MLRRTGTLRSVVGDGGSVRPSLSSVLPRHDLVSSSNRSTSRLHHCVRSRTTVDTLVKDVEIILSSIISCTTTFQFVTISTDNSDRYPLAFVSRTLFTYRKEVPSDPFVWDKSTCVKITHGFWYTFIDSSYLTTLKTEISIFLRTSLGSIRRRWTRQEPLQCLL